MTMVRKQVFITVEQNRALKKRAKATGRRVSWHVLAYLPMIPASRSA